MEAINARIRDEICYNTLEELTDTNLMPEYLSCPSVKNEIKKLTDILSGEHIDEDTRDRILQKYSLDLIPPGTKGAIRGNKFNKIVKEHITNLSLDTERFDIRFEEKCDCHFTSEIPDWFIRERSTNKIIIGMNQLDLTSGGHQINRGYKYVIDNKHNTENSKLLCVICNEIQFKSKKNKAYNLFATGFTNNTLCYLNNLKNIITLYFK